MFSPQKPVARPPRPKLRDEPASERPELFRQKLQVQTWGKAQGISMDFTGFQATCHNFCWDYGFETNFM
jgi:hypothetical protein